MKCEKIIICFNFFFRYFGTNHHLHKTDTDLQSKLHDLQDNIIEKSKILIVFKNRIVQEEAKYVYLKSNLIKQNYNPDTLPRPNPTKRRMKTQTAGLPSLFGGSLEEYYEATGEKIPLVVESCIKYINTFGMNHQGIFRIAGAHVSYRVKL